MVSPVVNVVRYSALVGGIGYGVVHRRTLQKREDARAIAAEKKHQEQLKVQAQKEKDQSIIASVRGGAGGVVTNPEDPKFDLEKYIASFDK
ncbi:hypothetical protein FA09DRAFT_327595 [Tilletiopsis washingtonensis]|uniref:ATP synthase F(0) complex subunit e, mitochondrial n=1 Tax=Tilletiopsis washingtonensis TaxID=58919 RepID=A0A316ZIV2_9BASI|nr:hypothetical protein FA09DRAFT_327595 [Tilletiopsis washingtonensis]PWO00883.1 hypothetical protein FA09DRAFT_327595 [Tilletiopsis washingtonensis]